MEWEGKTFGLLWYVGLVAKTLKILDFLDDFLLKGFLHKKIFFDMLP